MILRRIFSSVHGLSMAIILFQSQEIPFYIQWKLSCSSRNHKDWYCQTNVTPFLLTVYSTQNFLHTTGMLILSSTSEMQNLYCQFNNFLSKKHLWFSDILFLDLWQALCKLINKWTSNLASTVKTLFKTLFCCRDTPQVHSWCLMIVRS